MNEHRRFRLAETRAPHPPLRRRLMSAALAAGALALGAGLGFAPAPVLAEESPDALIERVGNELIRLIADDEAIKRGDMGAINRLVDEKVMPYVNFERMTALSAGRWWREATPEQRKQFLVVRAGVQVHEVRAGVVRDLRPRLAGHPEAHVVLALEHPAYISHDAGFVVPQPRE